MFQNSTTSLKSKKIIKQIPVWFKCYHRSHTLSRAEYGSVQIMCKVSMFSTGPVTNSHCSRKIGHIHSVHMQSLHIMSKLLIAPQKKNGWQWQILLWILILSCTMSHYMFTLLINKTHVFVFYYHFCKKGIINNFVCTMSHVLSVSIIVQIYSNDWLKLMMIIVLHSLALISSVNMPCFTSIVC